MKLLPPTNNTEKITISFSVLARHYRFNKHPLEIAIQEKVGLPAQYDDYTGTIRIYHNSSKTSFYEEQLYADTKLSLDKATVSSKTTVILHIPVSVMPIRQFKGKISLSKETLKLLYELSRGNAPFYTSFSYLTDITGDLDYPICTSDGLYYRSILSYYKAMQVQTYSERKAISYEDYRQSRLTLDPLLVRPDWNSTQKDVLFKALHYKVTQDKDFYSSLIGTYPFPIVYFNYSDLDYNDVLGVDFDKQQYMNILGQVLMNLRHELVFNQSELPCLDHFKTLLVA